MTAATVCRRGTSNSDSRGSSMARRRRREWLIDTFRADVDLVHPTNYGREIEVRDYVTGLGLGIPACRCYRCGVLLDVDGVTVDRIIPGIEGGTYRRNNIRPACARCNSITGGVLGGKRRWRR